MPQTTETELRESLRRAGLLNCRLLGGIDARGNMRSPLLDIYRDTEKTYGTMGRRALALEDRFYLLTQLLNRPDAIHPWRDGCSSERVLAAVDDLLSGRLGELAPKPTNLWRKLQIRSRLRHF